MKPFAFIFEQPSYDWILALMTKTFVNQELLIIIIHCVEE